MALISRTKPRKTSPRNSGRGRAAVKAPARATRGRPRSSSAPAAKSTGTSPTVAAAKPDKAYLRALEFLHSHTDYERMRVVRYNTTTFNLDRMRLLLKYLDNPHLRFKSVHVAGTKGKGSTCTMVAAMLQSAGFKTGLYTSPHLLNIRERIVIDGEMVSTHDLVRLVKKIEPIVRKMSNDPPTFFEILTAMAFSYFADQNVQIAVIETGLGGRLDSTNVIMPEVTAITNISLDHMAILGNTVARIAEEKAGIFKKDIPALSCDQPAEVKAALEKIARQTKAPLHFVGSDIEFSYRFEITRQAGALVRVTLITERSHFEHVTVPLIGEHQAVNCGLALAILDRLKGRGLAFDDLKALEGLERVKLPGRIEMVWPNPRVIIDGAHNAASVQALFRGISQYIAYDSMVVIFGCNSDKDIDGMLEQVSLGADKVIFTRAQNNPKSASPEELSSLYVERFGKMAQVAQNFQEAMSIATRAITREDLVTVTGSFYLIGEAKRHFMETGAATGA
jgi:dihydrofolate synthase/folylpolyglutamate synthase